MEKMLNKYIAMLVGALMLSVSFSSCTDEEEIGITFESGINVTAAHLFSDFQPIGSPKDFEMDGNQTLCLQVLIYDNNGHLVCTKKKEYGSLNSNLYFNPSLPKGKYKVISIASFKSDDNCWDVDNVEDIEYLTIASTIKYTGVFTTLGLNESELTVDDKGVSLQVDIKPITSLINVFFWNNELGTTTVSYTPLASYVEETIIKVDDHNNKVNFADNAIGFSPISNGISYELCRDFPYANEKAGKKPTTYTYMAMLPTNNISFFYKLKFTKAAQMLLDGETEVIGERTKQIDLESGKQYSLDMLMEGPVLFLSEYNKFETDETRLNRLIIEYNEELMRQNLKLIETTVGYNFHTLIGQSKDTVKRSLNFEWLSGTDKSDAYRAASDMLGMEVYVIYWDSTKTRVKQVVVNCAGCFADPSLSMDSFHQFLVKKYIYQDLLSTPQLRYYYGTAEFKDTKYVVVLDNTNQKLIYDAPELH